MIGIIGAMEEEVRILREELSDMKTDTRGDSEYYSGTLRGKEVVLLRSGIGKVQAAVGCTTLINMYSPSIIINTGSAGGINVYGSETFNIGDAIISTSLVQHDFDITAFGYARGQVPGRDSAYFPVEIGLVEKAITAVNNARVDNQLPVSFKALPGLVATGDIFVSDSTHVLDLMHKFPGIRAVEMEGAAIAQTCVLFKVPFIVLRCISDIANEKSPMSFDEYLPIAAKHSSEIVKRFIEILE
ncbi:MAG: 5'-methylthioadenosine/adenosylhomocysteine nucleosidase [Spirochaetaceae bacterium]|jgi:adenosylhomocysteine nucleosidase|nr:5'-methylthioadenosine/adenosylhomocysteine nucleosidase [Spirochaetaceae bacterium]